MVVKKWVWKEAAEVVGAVGIIAGLVFLGFELHQNNELLQAEARYTRVLIRLEEHWLPIRNPDLAQTLIKHREGSELSEYEKLILDRAMEAQLVIFQNVFTEFQRGLIDEDSIPVESWRTSFSGETLSMPGGWPSLRQHWELTKLGFDADFVAWMEENVVN